MSKTTDLVINEMNKVDKFEFTFKTNSELSKAEMNCNDFFGYDAIRVERTFDDGQTIDVPIKTEEEYNNFLNGDNLNFHINDPRVIKGSVKLYQKKHGYENKYAFDY